MNNLADDNMSPPFVGAYEPQLSNETTNQTAIVGEQESSNLDLITQSIQQLKPKDIAQLRHSVVLGFGDPQFKTYSIIEAGIEINNTDVSNYLALTSRAIGSDAATNYCMVDAGKRPVWAFNNYLDFKQRGFIYSNLPTTGKPLFVYVVRELEAFFKLSACKLPCVLVPLSGDLDSISDPTSAARTAIKKTVQALQDEAIQVYTPVPAHQVPTFKIMLDGSKARVISLPDAISQCAENAELTDYLTNAKQQVDQQAITWEKLQPLEPAVIANVNSYPIEAFPAIIANAIKKSAIYHDVPLAMAGQIYLGEMAFMAQSHIDAPSDKSAKGQPCSLAMFTIFPSGDGKDNCINDACKVSMSNLDKQMQDYQEDKLAWSNSDPKERGDPPRSPLNRFKKLTTQGLVTLISKGGSKSYTWTTGEGAYLLSGYNMKSDTVGESLSVINDLVDTGRSNNVIKGLDEAEYLADVRFSINIAVQNVVAKPALHNDLLREQGFLARFLFAAPDPLKNIKVTKQKRQMKPYNDPDIKAYWELCSKLITDAPAVLNEQSSARRLIVKSDSADDVHIDYENFINEHSELKGKYSLIAAYAKRTKQYVLRVAAILAFFDDKTVIDADVMANAIKICKHSIDEWINYYGAHEKTDSEILLEWLLDQKTTKVLKSSINQNVRKLKTVPLRDAAIKHLIDTGYVTLDKIGKSEYVVLNPTILKSV